MGLVEISGRPARWMVRMGMVKPHDVQALFPRLTLNADQFLRGNVVAIVSGIGPRVARAHRDLHLVRPIKGFPEQYSAALMGVGFLAVLAQLAIYRLTDVQLLLQTCRRHYCSQNRSLRYLSAESHRMVTTTA